MTRYCTQCGKETDWGKFCVHCGAPPPKKKNRGCLIAAAIVGGVVILALIAVVVFALLSPFRMADPLVNIADIMVTTDALNAGTHAPVKEVPPDAADIMVYGQAENLREDTLIDLVWIDETSGGVETGRVGATVDTERGIFYGHAALPMGPTFRLMYSGDYRVDVYVNGEEEPSFSLPLAVRADPPPEDVTYPVNDAYMIALQPDGSCSPVTAYPDGTVEVYAMLSFADMDADTAWAFHWMYMVDGDWAEIRADAEFTPVAPEPNAGLYYAGIAMEEGAVWPPGEYRVEVFLSDKPDAPSAAVNFTVEGSASGPALRNISMTTDLDTSGAPVDNITEYPYGIQSFVCSFYCTGTDNTTIAWEWYGADGLLGARQENTITEDGYYWVRFDHPQNQAFPPGEYRLVFYFPDLGEGSVAEIPFTVSGTSSLPVVSLDEGSLPLTEEEWAEWNDWLMVFTEGRLTPFTDPLPADADLINFGVLYNYFYNEEMYATLDDYGVCWLSEAALDYTLWFFLDAEVTNGSTDLVLYEGETYGFKAPEEALPYIFPQVRGIYEREDDGYMVEFEIYTAPVGFADFNGDYDSWEAGEIIPEYIGEMRAWVRFVTEDGETRRVLASYDRIE